MGIILILPILVAGYIYCMSSLYMKYRMHKYDGQLLYLLVGKFGIIFFSISAILTAIIFYICKKASFDICSYPINLDYIKYIRAFLVRNHISEEASVSKFVFFLHSSLISFILARYFPVLYIWLVKKRHKLLSTDQAKYFVLSGVVKGGIEKSLLNSIIEPGLLYMCSMSDRKVYVGTVSAISEPDEIQGVAEDFSLVPVYSGYRDKDSLSVCFNTFYKEIKKENGEDFTIHLKKENIVSMTLFEYDLFSKFQPKKEKHWVLKILGV